MCEDDFIGRQIVDPLGLSHESLSLLFVRYVVVVPYAVFL